MSGPVTECEKMLAGEPYDSRDPELLEMYHRARDLRSAGTSPWRRWTRPLRQMWKGNRYPPVGI